MKKIRPLIAAAGGFCHAADGTPMDQGLHQWPALGGVYFITADKKADHGYTEKGDITVTWHKLVTDDKDFPDGPGYLFKPGVTHSYPKSSLSVEEALAREVKLAPKK